MRPTSAAPARLSSHLLAPPLSPLLKGAVFSNAVLSGTTFENADLSDTDWTDAYIGMFDQKRLCKNPKLTGENPKTGFDTRESAGCKPL